MGGAIDVVINANPFAEFNLFADPEAAAIIYVLTDPQSSTTFPTTPHHFREEEWEKRPARALNLRIGCAKSAQVAFVLCGKLDSGNGAIKGIGSP
ncbi:nucleoside hydrolase [Penicillium lagena]|uniref:nucleoside hydrolase n=1 Tax=Penicillium lagena TaxID=94218 RepID=UPI0025408EBA|nr:nucleoside hydrolase [Penicillium lagena]KAJ5612301.1 nucleoside hydrolase [Penicillium lagena]